MFCHCPKKVIQSIPPSKSAFDVLGVPRRFAVDLSQLSRKFRDLQRHMHPDKFANASSEAQAVADVASGRLNKANSTLKDPLARGLHMLELGGRKVTEHASISDPDFLMEIMELNEEIDDVAPGSDDAKALRER